MADFVHNDLPHLQMMNRNRWEMVDSKKNLFSTSSSSYCWDHCFWDEAESLSAVAVSAVVVVVAAVAGVARNG